MSGTYRLILAFWLGLFLVSLIILLMSLRSMDGSGAILPPFPGNGQETSGSDDRPESGDSSPEDPGGQWSLVLSTVSAIISAAGFMATTYFALRNDRRQSALAELEIQKLAHEVERQKLEIEKMKREQQNGKSPPGG